MVQGRTSVPWIVIQRDVFKYTCRAPFASCITRGGSVPCYSNGNFSRGASAGQYLGSVVTCAGCVTVLRSDCRTEDDLAEVVALTAGRIAAAASWILAGRGWRIQRRAHRQRELFHAPDLKVAWIGYGGSVPYLPPIQIRCSWVRIYSRPKATAGVA